MEITAPTQPVDVIDRWIETLESGKYPQGTGYLKTSEGYCCMGVLWEIAGGKWSNPESGSRVYTSVYPMLNGTRTGTIREIELKEWGLHLSWQAILTAANDHGGTFAQIAAFLREHRSELKDNIHPSVGVWRYSWNQATKRFVSG